MADALQCTPRWVSRIESGQAQPSEELAARYAARLRVSLDTLLAPVPHDQGMRGAA